MKVFENKKNVKIYIPIGYFDEENFIIELLDLCSAYLNPLQFDVNKQDIIDYFENYSNKSFYDFLKFKRYIAECGSFFELAKKYSNENSFYEISIENVTYQSILEFFVENKICNLININEQIKSFTITEINKI